MSTAQTLEVPTESVKAVTFSFFTDEEARKQSVVKITKTELVDEVGTPVQGGLYDPALGPLANALCKTCGQNSFNCRGHFGHIGLVLPVYNPLLFNILYKLLQRTCFFCYRFRTSQEQVQKCVSQLELVMKGDVVAAKRLDSDTPNEFSYLEEEGGVNQNDRERHSKPQRWTSLQFTEAMSILDSSLDSQKKCKNCSAKNPKITKPTFGWFQMAGAEFARENVIRGCKLVGPLTSEDEGESFGNDVDVGTSDVSCGSSLVTQDTATKRSKGQESSVTSEFFKQKKSLSGDLLPTEVKEIMKLLWTNEASLCSFLSDIHGQADERKGGHSMFFLETVLVPPVNVRPPAKAGDSVTEHPHTVSLSKVVLTNTLLKEALGHNKHSATIRYWRQLQDCTSLMFDSKTGAGPNKSDASGICQLLEKKEGMFRQKMMGKRVNFACRSVISPDPYLAVNEIGIPPSFALTLTYPERVTPWNVLKLRNAIVNGSEVHPGATHYIDKASTLLPQKRRERVVLSRKLLSSKGAVTQRGKGSDYENKIVLRHLEDGDIVLVNRQPTLHKPSIMAHVVRVLKGEKTIRMHYANCSTYNADFDGDEMNVHFPQDDISRAEAYNMVNANNQYVKPTSGDPIRALIQDHIIGAVLLTKKDTFLRSDEFNQLLYSSCVSACPSDGFTSKPGQKVSMSNSEDAMKPILPAIWKPVRCWTGKQVITTLLNHITSGSPPLTVEKEAKLPSGFFNCKNLEGEEKSDNHRRQKEKKPRKKESDKDKSMEKEELDESKLLIYRNNLVRGVIDKNQFGDYGLVHNVQELYGSEAAGKLLSVFSRLYTVFLQMHGFTCGVDDLLVIQKKDKQMKEELESCEVLGEQVFREFIGVREDEKKDPVILQSDIEEFLRSNGQSVSEILDRKMTSELNKKISKSDVFKQIFQKGLSKPSVKNYMYLMTSSGAKGGVANLQQIASYLGQQELEGKRVPQMVSGKTLPCFPPWDWSPRAGGFIIDRFLTGLHPQEYYFHCMAGREGLVDTAVKTSRSGYLQRCLIKNLECLKVCYDHTVRDADGSIIQFRYGEDGVDVHLTSFIKKFEKLANNKEMFDQRYCRQIDKFNPYIDELPPALKRKAETSVPNMSLKEKKAILKLMEHKYLSSLAQPGEPVGILAAQSVGEPSTQMTLNTFHNAGRSEMNVTLGIPRLQEILMTASSDIKTPVMTCPLLKEKATYAKSLGDIFKRITVADIIESMKVTITPLKQLNHQTCCVYELEMALFIPEHLSKVLEDWEELLEVKFVRALEDAIQNHIVLLSKISGIKDIKAESVPKASNGTDDDVSFNISSHYGEDDDDEGADEHGAGAEDFGSDAQKQKRQGTDEMEYEDDCEDEAHGDGFESEIEKMETDVESDVETEKSGVSGVSDANDEMPASPLKSASKPKPKKKKTESKDKTKKKTRAKLVRKEYDRSIFMSAKGLHFEVHFRFTDEPHILLDQIARKTAQNVYIKSSGKILDCKDIDIYGNEDQVFCSWNDPRNKLSNARNPTEEEKEMRALQAAGVDFATFWKLQDDLDVNYIYSNNIHAMLNTYGVEAARETIIKEISNVFKVYGISVNIRHLSLIAEYMTFSGGYRPMNRFGGIAESISPINKMSFETASKFIREAAYHRDTDDLETPSARICLGLPVKVGTGCFDLMQKMEI